MAEKYLGGEWLRQIREEDGVSLKEAGERVEPPLSFSYLSRLERGDIDNPTLDRVTEIAVAYGVSNEDVLRAYYPFEDGQPDIDSARDRRLISKIGRLNPVQRKALERLIDTIIE